VRVRGEHGVAGGRRRPYLSWNARDRRLRAALAALLVHDQAARATADAQVARQRHLDTRHLRPMILTRRSLLTTERRAQCARRHTHDAHRRPGSSVTARRDHP
jgi:hypothetical protein